MAKLAKFLQGVAGAAGGEALNVEEVFSTYLYDGTGSSQTITNGIDLDGEGGLVWMKARSTAESHILQDTDGTGVGNVLLTNSTSGMISVSGTHLSAFNSNGFSIGTSTDVNRSGTTMASWTFRKAPKFFDVVTYTGDGNDNRTVSHNLGSSPGVVIVKKTSAADSWIVWHRSVSTGYLSLNVTSALQNYTSRIKSANDTTFTLGTSGQTNSNGATYVAYLFAHNDGDGEFGPDGDADIIKCGSYTGNGSATGPSINLGFEPQWLLIKGTSSTDSWAIFDVMRGMTVGASDSYLFPNSSGAELSYSSIVKPTPTGFQLESVNWNTNANNYIYIAIRRGPMAVPESATDVFDVAARVGASGNQGAYQSGFPVDMAFHKVVTSSINPYEIGSRLTQGKSMKTNATDAESTTSDQQYDYMDGWNSETSAASTKYSWMWKRAPNYFDVVAYKGNGQSYGASAKFNHNLGVEPEMIWYKVRSLTTSNWVVYHKDVGLSNILALNSNLAEQSVPNALGNMTETTFGVLDYVSPLSDDWRFNRSGAPYIAYLFASLDGVSKVGSYTGNGTSQVIDCGFSSGARFVLIKRTDTSGTSWQVMDTERGIVAGNDPRLQLESVAAEATNSDVIDPNSSGFEINNGFTDFNANGGSYIFYAIA